MMALFAVGLVGGGLTISGMHRAGAYPAPVPEKSKQGDATKTLPVGKGSSVARREEEKSLRETIRAYCDAFNQGDLETILAFWTEDAEHVDEFGKVLRGREALRSLLKRSLSQYKGSKLTIKVDSLRFIRHDVISEQGSVFMTAPDGAVEPGRYCALWVKQVGKWLISSVRDLPDPAPDDQPAAARLKSLAWMVGEWEEKGAKSEVRMTCKWGPNQTFLIQDFTVRRADGTELTSTQRIGWDAPRNRFARGCSTRRAASARTTGRARQHLGAEVRRRPARWPSSHVARPVEVHR